MATIENAPQQQDKPRVFISYNRDDLEFADQLHAILQLTGFEAILDREHIKAGEDWQTRLSDLIRSADTVIFVLSPSSAASKVCQWELTETERLCKRILPVVCRPLKDANPPQVLTALNYIFFYHEPRKSGSGFAPALTELVDALNTDLVWLRKHTRYLERATEWKNGGYAKDRLLFGSDITKAKDWAAHRPKDAPELQDRHLEYIRASEQEEIDRKNFEKQRLEEIAAAQDERQKALESTERALKDKQIAQQRAAEASKKVVRRTFVGMAVALALAVLSATAGGYAYFQQQEAVSQRKIADDEREKAEQIAEEAENQRKIAENLNIDLKKSNEELENLTSTLLEEHLKVFARLSIQQALLVDLAPGEIQATTEGNKWKTLLGENTGDQNTQNSRFLVATREYGKGRIIGAGHHTFITTKDDKDITTQEDKDNQLEKQELVKRAIMWAANSLKPEAVMITAGHCEQKSLQEINLPSDKLQLHVTYHASRLNAEALKDIDVLMVGNAWGNFSDTEITAVESFVKNGGGLMAVGLGWNWKTYGNKPKHNKCKGRNGFEVSSMDNYPMNKLLGPLGLKWTGEYFQ